MSNAVEAVLQRSAAALLRLSLKEPGNSAWRIHGAGVLVAILSGGPESKAAANAAAALLNLAAGNDDERRAAIIAAGAIAPLVALLDGSEGAEAQEAAAGAILALAETVANRLIITEAGGIGFLVSML